MMINTEIQIWIMKINKLGNQLSTTVIHPFLSSSSLLGFAQRKIVRWHTLGYGSLMCIISAFTDIAYSIMLYTHMLNISSILSCCIHTSYWNIQHLEYFNNPTPPHSATPVWVLHQDGIWRLLNRVYMNTSSDTSFSSNIYFVLVSENHCHRDHMSSSASK